MLLGVALLLGFLARGSGDAIAFLAIPLLVLVPPAPIRCQSCGVVNARQWGFWFVRATLGGLYGFLAFQVMAHPERLR